MAGQIGQGVTLRGFYDEDSQFTWNISGAVTRANVGNVMAQDITVANTAKLAGDNDEIIGVLNSFEQRIQEGLTVGTIGMSDNAAVAYTGALAIGDSICGSATPGVAKKAAARNNTRVVELQAGNIAVVLFRG